MQKIELFLNRQSLNFLTALMPTMDGLFMATVKDGKKGQVVLSFSIETRPDIVKMIACLAKQFPEDKGWMVS